MWPLRLFNAVTREVSPFAPRDPPDVGVYSCGPTVYADQHIGNMRAYVFADTLKRTLRWKGYRVRHVINITDVEHLTSDADVGDDKIELAARREHRSIWEIAEHYTKAFKRDLNRLRVGEPDLWSKATDHIQEMIALERAGWCYRLPNAVLRHGPRRRLRQAGPPRRRRPARGARVEAVEGKRNPSEFAVWRTAGPGEQRQMVDAPTRRRRATHTAGTRACRKARTGQGTG